MTPILSALERYKLRRTGQGKFQACCPAHEDRSPSLSIKEEADGKILLYCFAGCTTQDIVDSLGLSMADLNPNWRPEDRQAYQQSKRNESLDHEKLILSIAAGDRARGKKLSEKDLARERLAWERVNGYN